MTPVAIAKRHALSALPRGSNSRPRLLPLDLHAQASERQSYCRRRLQDYCRQRLGAVIRAVLGASFRGISVW